MALTTFGIKDDCKNLCFVGADPAGTGFLKILLKDMSQGQLKAWLETDRKTALRYIIQSISSDEQTATTKQRPGTETGGIKQQAKAKKKKP